MFNLFKLVLASFFLFFFQSLSSSEKSTLSALATKSLLLQSDQYGELTVVVGERGHVLYSHDKKSWQQASVETRQTLTNVFMLNENKGWAVGHDAIILETNDAGKNWNKIFSAIDEEAPLLDIFFKDEQNGIAIGAYSLVFITKDGGKTWNKSSLKITNVYENQNKTNDAITDIIDIHLNDISYAGNKRFYLAAESGRILRSDDNAETWIDLNSPYQGSFFGVLPLSFNELIVFGLRGHLYFSSDAGHSWEKINTNSSEMLTDAVLLSNDIILVSGLAGTLLISYDKGKSFSSVDLKRRYGLTSILEYKDGSILLTSDNGVELLSQEIFSPKQ